MQFRAPGRGWWAREGKGGGGPGLSGRVPGPERGRPTWAGLTLAGRGRLATLPSQILNIVQGNGPQRRLAPQSVLKHDLTEREGAL